MSSTWVSNTVNDPMTGADTKWRVVQLYLDIDYSEQTLDQWLWSSGSCEVSDVRSIVELWGPGTRSTFQHLKAFTHTQGQSPVGDSGQLYRQSEWCGVLGDRDSCTHRLCTLGSWYSSDTWTVNTDNTSHQIFCILHLRHVTSRDEKIFECLYSEARVKQVNILVIIVSMFSSVIIMIIIRAGN